MALKLNESSGVFKDHREVETGLMMNGGGDDQFGSFAITSDNSFNMLSRLSIDLDKRFEIGVVFSAGTVKNCPFFFGFSISLWTL